MTNTQLCEIGKRIHDLRKEKNWTQEQLAEKSSLTPQFISYAETGKRQMRIGGLLQISLALETSTDYILTGDIIDKDKLQLSEKLDRLTSREIRIIKNIIDECIALNHSDE